MQLAALKNGGPPASTVAGAGSICISFTVQCDPTSMFQSSSCLKGLNGTLTRYKAFTGGASATQYCNSYVVGAAMFGDSVDVCSTNNWCAHSKPSRLRSHYGRSRTALALAQQRSGGSLRSCHVQRSCGDHRGGRRVCALRAVRQHPASYDPSRCTNIQAYIQQRHHTSAALGGSAPQGVSNMSATAYTNSPRPVCCLAGPGGDVLPKRRGQIRTKYVHAT